MSWAEDNGIDVYDPEYDSPHFRHFTSYAPNPLLHFLLGGALLILCFAHPFFIVFFVGYLFYTNAQSHTVPTTPSTPPTLHGRDLSTLDAKELFMHRKDAYLKSSIWSQKRNQILARDHYACTSCGRHTSLNVHHIRYSNIFNEQPADLLTLCSDCHTALHDRVGYPQSYNDYMTKEYK